MDNRRENVTRSQSIALSGVICSLAVLIMFLTGIFPMVATFILPAISGLVLLLIYYELGFSTALLAYFATSLLSLFMVPDREAALFFIFFFGHYPLIRFKLEEKIKNRFLKTFVKLLIFNFCFFLAYAFIALIFGLNHVLGADFGRTVFAIFAVMGNFTFIMYDYILTSFTFVYYKFIRARLISVFK